jgi:hypothetical protein
MCPSTPPYSQNEKQEVLYGKQKQDVLRGIALIAKKRIGLFVSLGVVAIMVMAAFPVRASLTQETYSLWKGNSNTVAYGVYAADIVSDVTGRLEILTAGSVYGGPAVGTLAQLKLWSWTGSTLTNVYTKEWRAGQAYTTEAYSVYAADVDGDSTVEIVTVGYGQSQGGSPYPEMVIWHWDGSALVSELDLSRDSSGVFRSVYAYNIDGTGGMEIAVVGEDGSDGALWVFNWYQGSASLKDEETWSGTEVRARSVFIEDVGWTAAKDILTAGYVVTGGAKYGQLRVYDYSNGALSLQGSDTHQFLTSATEFFSVTAAEFYSGYGKYIAACGGFGRAGVAFWNVVSGSLTHLNNADATWPASGTAACHGVYGADIVTGSADVEVIAAGFVEVSSTDNGNIHIFNTHGGAPFNTDDTYWYDNVETQAWGVYAADVDADSTVEVLSVGQSIDSNSVLWADLRIWHV